MKIKGFDKNLKSVHNYYAVRPTSHNCFCELEVLGVDIFCTKESKIRIFDIQTDMTMNEFKRTEWYRVFKLYPVRLTKWIKYSKEEKRTDKNKAFVGGYLKKYSFKEACWIWWDELPVTEKEVVMTLPNFDKDKFFEITGIDIEE